MSIKKQFEVQLFDKKLVISVNNCRLLCTYFPFIDYASKEYAYVFVKSADILLYKLKTIVRNIFQLILVTNRSIYSFNDN